MSALDIYAAAWRKHLRLAILRTLLASPGRSANESLLMDNIRMVGIGATREQVREECVWLHTERLISGDVAHGVIVALLTEAGTDIAEGRVTHPDIKRPTAGLDEVAREAFTAALAGLKK